MRKLKRFLLVLFILIAAFAVYVEIVNRNSKNMTYRQKVLKAVYPALMWLTRITGKNSKQLAHEKVQPPVSFISYQPWPITVTAFHLKNSGAKKCYW